METKSRTIRPLGGRILIKRSSATASKGGILLPESSQEKPKQGVVMAVGPGKYDEKGKVQPVELKEGQTVLFSSYSGTEVKMDDEENDYMLLAEDDVLAILEANNG